MIDDDDKVHTTPEEGHPAGDGERTDREVGGPTNPENPSDEDDGGEGATGTRESGFDPH